MKRATLLFLSLSLSSLTVQASPDEIQKGQKRYNQNCASCHGVAGEGRGIFPKVSGSHTAEIEEKMNIYRSYGQIGSMSSLMYTHVSTLSDEETHELSEYIATLK